MKELKFRAWDGEDMYIPEIQENEQGENINDWFASFRNVTLMQYTGLKDKNGKEIYEGDIIKVSSSSPNLELIEEVKWISDGDWMADKQPLVGFIHHSSIYKKPIEIIGNIYENPELLTN